MCEDEGQKNNKKCYKWFLLPDVIVKMVTLLLFTMVTVSLIVLLLVICYRRLHGPKIEIRFKKKTKNIELVSLPPLFASLIQPHSLH